MGNGLKERHHFSFDNNIVHRKIGDKQNIAFPLLVGILTSTSKISRKFLSIVVQHLHSSETDEWAHFPSDAFWWYTHEQHTEFRIFFFMIMHNHVMNCKILINNNDNNGGTHTKPVLLAVVCPLAATSAAYNCAHELCYVATSTIRGWPALSKKGHEEQR